MNWISEKDILRETSMTAANWQEHQKRQIEERPWMCGEIERGSKETESKPEVVGKW
jgi:hypothetical protein